MERLAAANRRLQQQQEHMHQQLLAMQTQTATSMQAQTLASTDFSRPNMEMEMRRELQTFQQQVSSPATLPPPPSAKTKIQEEEEIKGVGGERGNSCRWSFCERCVASLPLYFCIQMVSFSCWTHCRVSNPSSEGARPM